MMLQIVLTGMTGWTVDIVQVNLWTSISGIARLRRSLSIHLRAIMASGLWWCSIRKFSWFQSAWQIVVQFHILRSYLLSCNCRSVRKYSGNQVAQNWPTTHQMVTSPALQRACVSSGITTYGLFSLAWRISGRAPLLGFSVVCGSATTTCGRWSR